MENTEYAGFWNRFGATIVDLIVFFIVISVPLSIIYGKQYWTGDQIVHGFWDVILGYILPFVATIWFWLRFLGTPGKMALNLQVVDACTGGRMTTGQAVGRYFAYILAALPLGLGFIWIAVDSRKRGWHDMLAGTVVLKVSKAPVNFPNQD